jgi:hypothetical protein
MTVLGDIIRKYPIASGLDNFREAYNKYAQTISSNTSFEDAINSANSNPEDGIQKSPFKVIVDSAISESGEGIFL